MFWFLKLRVLGAGGLLGIRIACPVRCTAGMREPVNPGNSTPPGVAGTFHPAPSDHLQGEPT